MPNNSIARLWSPHYNRAMTHQERGALMGFATNLTLSAMSGLPLLTPSTKMIGNLEGSWALGVSPDFLACFSLQGESNEVRFFILSINNKLENL